MTSPGSQADETSIFRQSWTIYDALSEMNYMHHREIFGEVARLLRERHRSGPWAMLDLGCGNGRFLGPCLRHHPPSSYVGIDLSPVALEEARNVHLAGLAGVTLGCSDMLEAVRTAEGPFDIIFSSYAVHHLAEGAKELLFRECARLLAPDGMVLLVDIVREDGQSREDYLSGYLGTMRREWTAVDPGQLEQACAHVAAFDYPETLSTLQRMAADAGWGVFETVCRHAQHHLILMRARSRACEFQI